jgi:hypothetical protein
VKANAGDKPQAADAGLQRHRLSHPTHLRLMKIHADEWRLESGTLPGFSVGDILEIDIADDDYTFSKPGAGPVTRLPITSTEEETVPIKGWLEVRNRAERVNATLSPTPKLVSAWWASDISEGRALGGSSKPST